MKIILKVDVRPDARGHLVTIQSGTRCMTHLPARAPTLAAAQCWALLQSLELALASGRDGHEVEIRCGFAPDRQQHYWRILQQRVAQGQSRLNLVPDEAEKPDTDTSWWISHAQALA